MTWTREPTDAVISGADTVVLVRGLSALPPAASPGLRVVCTLSDGESAQHPALTGGDSPLFISFAADAPPAKLVEASPLSCSVLAIAAPWDETPDIAAWLPRGRRCLVVSAVGDRRGRWCDGPLAHVLADGTVASYLPSGGGGALLIPRQTAANVRGVPLSAALALEGSAPERAHRCLLGQVTELLQADEIRARGGAPAAAEDHVLPLTLHAESFSLTAAVTLALVRQARPREPLALVSAVSARSMPPPWRRLCQNLGVTASDTPAGGIRLADLSAGLSTTQAATVAMALNSISDVLPKTLI